MEANTVAGRVVLAAGVVLGLGTASPVVGPGQAGHRHGRPVALHRGALHVVRRAQGRRVGQGPGGHSDRRVLLRRLQQFSLRLPGALRGAEGPLGLRHRHHVHGPARSRGRGRSGAGPARPRHHGEVDHGRRARLLPRGERRPEGQPGRPGRAGGRPLLRDERPAQRDPARRRRPLRATKQTFSGWTVSSASASARRSARGSPSSAAATSPASARSSPGTSRATSRSVSPSTGPRAPAGATCRSTTTRTGTDRKLFDVAYDGPRVWFAYAW